MLLFWGVSLGLTACGSEPVPSPSSPTNGANEEETEFEADTADSGGVEPLEVPFEQGVSTEGQTLFATDCVPCHGEAGDRLSPGFATTVPTMSDDQLARQMVYGTDRMPAQDLELIEVAHLIAWLRETFPG